MRIWIPRVLLTVAIVAAYWFFAPFQAPGGKSAFMITSGSSMAPLYHSGDLVILRQSGSYEVGDIAGYHAPDLNNDVVLHRIVSVQNGRFTFQGDNRDVKPDPDPTPVTQDAIVGKAWIHVQKGGLVMKWIEKPLHAALLVLVAVFLSFGGAGVQRVRGGGFRRRERPVAPAPETEGGAPAGAGAGPALLHSQYALPVVGGLAGLFALLSLMAFSASPTRTAIVPDAYTESVDWGYSGTAPKSPVYPSGKIATGDTVFRKQIDGPLRLRVTYDLTAKDRSAPVISKGTVSILEHIEGDNLWQRDAVLVPPRPLETNGPTTVGTTLRLDKLSKLLQTVEDATGYPASQAYKITLTAKIAQQGSVGGQALASTFAPTMLLDYDKVRLYPDLGPTGAAPDSFASSQGGAGTTTVDSNIDLKLFALSVPVARIVGAAGVGVALAILAALLLVGRRRSHEDEPARIAAAYGDWIVPVTHMTEPAAPFADVASFDALVSLASRSDRAIMHYASDGAHTYFVKEDDVVYRYTTREAPRPASVEPVPVAEESLLPDAPAEAAAPEPPSEPVAEEWGPPVLDAQPADIQPAPARPLLGPLEDLSVVPLEELPSPVAIQPIAPPSAPAPVVVSTPPPAPVPSNGGFVPESPETAYQPAPVSMPPVVVPQQPPATPAPPQPAPEGPAMPTVAPVAPAAPVAPLQDAGLIRETFLRPRPRQGDA